MTILLLKQNQILESQNISSSCSTFLPGEDVTVTKDNTLGTKDETAEYEATTETLGEVEEAENAATEQLEESPW